MAFHVRDRATDALVRKLAAQERVGLTDAVRIAVAEKIHRNEAQIETKLEQILEWLEELDRRPRTGLKADKAFFDELSGD